MVAIVEFTSFTSLDASMWEHDNNSKELKHECFFVCKNHNLPVRVMVNYLPHLHILVFDYFLTDRSDIWVTWMKPSLHYSSCNDIIVLANQNLLSQLFDWGTRTLIFANECFIHTGHTVGMWKKHLSLSSIFPKPRIVDLYPDLCC